MMVDIAKMYMPIKPMSVVGKTKAELIEYIRLMEHNYNVAVAFNEQQARNIERIEREDGWIKITDSIPMNGSDVLAFQDNGEEARIVPANYDNGVWYDCVFNAETDNITHWRYLPEPPTKE